jgi:hypothetical protein
MDPKFATIIFQLYVSLAGLFVVGLSIVFAYGLAMFCGVIYGPVHALMPFLLLGNSHKLYSYSTDKISIFFLSHACIHCT